MKAIKNTSDMKRFILTIFGNTDLDQDFINNAYQLGYIKYFETLGEVDNLTDRQIKILYNRINKMGFIDCN
jgi:ribosomal protein S8